MSATLHNLATSSGVLFGTSGARGLVAQMSDAICYAYAQAFIRAVAAGANRVVIGHDLRPSSPIMATACAQAVTDAGMDVIFVGPMPTPGVAFYAATLLAPAIIITGSHIPFDRNGIKFYRAEGEISKADEQAMLESAVELPANLAPMLANRLANKPLPDIAPDALSAYLDRYIVFFGRGALQGSRMAIYEHSSVALDILRNVLEALGAGARQDSCRLLHATNACKLFLSNPFCTTASRSGLSVTAPTAAQLRVVPDHRAGLRSRAWTYKSCLAARIW